MALGVHKIDYKYIIIGLSAAPEHILAVQVKGEMRVAEFALANDPEEYEFTCTAETSEGSAEAQVPLTAPAPLKSSGYTILQARV